MRTIAVTLAVVLATFVAQAAHAQAQKGGVASSCDNVCKLVKTTIKKKVICYGCKCEDFCVPGKSCLERDGLCDRGCKSNCACKGKGCNISIVQSKALDQTPRCR